MNELDLLVESARQSFAQAATPADLENAKAQFLGKSGRVTELKEHGDTKFEVLEKDNVELSHSYQEGPEEVFYDGDGNDDLLWYAPGSGPDSVWFGGPGGAFDRRSTSVSGTYQPVVVDLEGDGRDDVLWYAPGAASDVWWRWASDRSVSSAGFVADGPHRPVVGAFSAGGTDGVLWYAAGSTPDGVWWR